MNKHLDSKMVPAGRVRGVPPSLVPRHRKEDDASICQLIVSRLNKANLSVVQQL